MLIMISGTAFAGEYYIATAYCPCFKCCGKRPSDVSYRVTASGKYAMPGMVACNHLKFGTRILIDGKPYTVEDRGAVSHFGTFKNPKKRLDIFFEKHSDALRFGRKLVKVEVLK